MEELKLLLFLAVLAMVVTLLHSFLKQAGRDEYAYLTLVLGLTVALLKVIPLLVEFFQQVESVFRLY